MLWLSRWELHPGVLCVCNNLIVFDNFFFRLLHYTVSFSFFDFWFFFFIMCILWWSFYWSLELVVTRLYVFTVKIDAYRLVRCGSPRFVKAGLNDKNAFLCRKHCRGTKPFAFFLFRLYSSHWCIYVFARFLFWQRAKTEFLVGFGFGSLLWTSRFHTSTLVCWCIHFFNWRSCVFYAQG